MDRGDIYHVDLNPIHGREQAGARYVMIISVREFNRLGIPIVCPITLGGSFARDRGFAVSLTGTGLTAQGVVLSNQLRALDLSARRAKFIEKVPQEIIDEVLGKVSVLFE
jgi:mRNA-degrading endonuclease toxin of MazEF toxin-antitoxin module